MWDIFLQSWLFIFPPKLFPDTFYIDKPTRVRSSSATLIDNIFVNTPDNITACGNIIQKEGIIFRNFVF